MSLVFLILAILIFLLVGFGADVGSVDPLELTAFGLAALAASLVPWPAWGPRAPRG